MSGTWTSILFLFLLLLFERSRAQSLSRAVKDAARGTKEIVALVKWNRYATLSNGRYEKKKKKKRVQRHQLTNLALVVLSLSSSAYRLVTQVVSRYDRGPRKVCFFFPFRWGRCVRRAHLRGLAHIRMNEGRRRTVGCGTTCFYAVARHPPHRRHCGGPKRGWWRGGGPFVSFPILSIYFIDFSCLLPSSWAYFTWPRNQMIRAGILRFTPNLICLPINSIAPLVLSDGEGEPFSAWKRTRRFRLV